MKRSQPLVIFGINSGSLDENDSVSEGDKEMPTESIADIMKIV